MKDSNSSLKNKIIFQLSYIHENKNNDSINMLKNMADSYDKDKKEKSDELLDEIVESNNNELNILFKKIKLNFFVLEDLIKYQILKIDDERYQKIMDEKIQFPRNMDSLILIMGGYGDAFDHDIQSELLKIIDLPFFNDLISISEINTLMIPFVANDEISLPILKKDYEHFSTVVKHFACDILGINTDFTTDSIYEYQSV